MEGLSHDVRHALRGLWKHPGFAMVTAITLALGIGSSTAIFSAVHAVLLRDLPYAAPDRILVVFHTNRENGERGAGLSPANARDLVERSTRLSAVAVAEPWGADVLVDGRAESLRAWAVSEGFFDAIAVEPALGRLFAPEEYVVGGDPVIVLGYRSWSTRFGADPGVVGGTVTLDDRAVNVVGVLPPDFKLPDEAEFWVPRPARSDDVYTRTGDYMMGVARLAPGATLEQARAEVDQVAATLGEMYPDTNTTLGFDLVPLREHLFGDVRTPLLVLMGAVGFVLLIACANVAGLMLARGAQRHREYALRSALGASTGRLVRQITIDSFLLAGLGCALGIGLTYLGVELIQRLGPDHLPRIEELSVDGVVLLFAVAVTGLSAVLSGVTPSMRLSRPDVKEALGDGARGSTAGAAGLALRNRLVVAEIAAAMVLLVGAGLLSKSFMALLDEELGFDPTDRLVVQAFAYDYPTAGERDGFIRQVAERMEAIPGVRRVALTSSVPAATERAISAIDIDLPYTIEDRAPPPVGQEPVAAISQVSAGYFDALEIEVLEGREFQAVDGPDAPLVIAINETLARQQFGDRSPVGERLVIGYQPVPREIVGVVADVRPGGHESDPRPEVYFPLAQFPTGSITFVLEAESDAGALTTAAMESIWQVNPSQSVWGATTLDALLADWLKERSFNLLLLGSFAVVALLLAGIGIYGLISFSVEQRIGEFGIRRALGGRSGSIVGMVLEQGARLAGAGVALGILGALILTRFIQGMLFGVEPTDPLTIGLLAAAVLAVAGLSALLPAVRAVRADPAEALRGE